MANATLTEIRLRNFKSFGGEEQAVEFRPLTVLIGPNNTGKSTILQSLLLLKQTLLDPRPEVALLPRGAYVKALSLRELTHGRPEDIGNRGPEICIRWTSTVDLRRVRDTGRRPFDIGKLAAATGLQWLASAPEEFQLKTALCLCYREIDSIISAQPIVLESFGPGDSDENPGLTVKWVRSTSSYIIHWGGQQVRGLELRLDHFLPYLVPTSEAEEPARRVWRLFRVLYEQPLQDLKELLLNLSYVGAVRSEPAELYPKPSSASTRDVLPDGAKAPELVYAHRATPVHCSPLVRADRSEQRVELSDRIEARPLEHYVDVVLQHLGIDVKVSLSDLQDLGFRLLFDGGSLHHVGRGIGQILPIIVAGLLSDPLLGEDTGADLMRAEYLARCRFIPTLVFEEVESHLHPRAQTRLAHFMVALARSGRQVFIETHSDHLVRRLRSLVARAASGEESEAWLLDNVRIIEVTQQNQVTSVHTAKLTQEGDIERWPGGFMDEASDEEELIYGARMKKAKPRAVLAEEEYLRNVRFLEKKG